VGSGVAADCTVVLRNKEDRYSPLNASSPLYGYLSAEGGYRLPVRVSVGFGGTKVTIFTGIINEPVEIAEAAKTATFRCRDYAQLLIDQRLSTVTYVEYQTDQLLTTLWGLVTLKSPILAGVSLTGDKGMRMISYGWLDDEPIWEEMRRIAEAEGGRVYFDPTGNLRFENAAHLFTSDHAKPKLTLAVESYADINAKWDLQNIVNQVLVRYTPRLAGLKQRVHETADEIVLPRRGSGANEKYLDIQLDTPLYPLSTTAPNLVINSGFELGERYQTDVPFWVASGCAISTDTTDAYDGMSLHVGYYAGGYVYQHLGPTSGFVGGLRYRLSAFLRTSSGTIAKTGDNSFICLQEVGGTWSKLCKLQGTATATWTQFTAEADWPTTLAARDLQVVISPPNDASNELWVDAISVQRVGTYDAARFQTADPLNYDADYEQTDYQAFNSGYGRMSDDEVNCILTEQYAQKLRVWLVNHSTKHTAYVPRIRFNAIPINPYEPRTTEARDLTSEYSYGLRSREISNAYVQNESDARALADTLLLMWKTPRQIASLTGLPGVPSLEIGDRLRVSWGTNLATNGDFEGNATTGWTKTNGGDTFAIQFDSYVFRGRYGAYFTNNTGGSQGIYQSVTLESGRSYYASAWVYQAQSGASTTLTLGTATHTTTTLNQWVLLSVGPVVGTGAAVNLKLSNATSGHYFYMDDVRLYADTACRDWFLARNEWSLGEGGYTQNLSLIDAATYYSCLGSEPAFFIVGTSKYQAAGDADGAGRLLY